MLGEEQAEVARKIYLRDSVLFSKQIGSEESYDEALQAYLQSRRSVLDNMLNQKEMSMQRIQEKERNGVSRHWMKNT